MLSKFVGRLHSCWLSPAATSAQNHFMVPVKLREPIHAARERVDDIHRKRQARSSVFTRKRTSFYPIRILRCRSALLPDRYQLPSQCKSRLLWCCGLHELLCGKNHNMTGPRDSVDKSLLDSFMPRWNWAQRISLSSYQYCHSRTRQFNWLWRL